MEGGRCKEGEGPGEEGERKGRASEPSESLHQHRVSGTLKRKSPSPLGYEEPRHSWAVDFLLSPCVWDVCLLEVNCPV